MKQNLICVFLLACIAVITASPAETAEHRHRHRHNKHQKKTHSGHESPNEINKRTLPPNIWSLLASNKRAHDDVNGPKSNAASETSHDANEIMDFGLPDHDESIKTKVSANCPKCKQNSVKMSEDELTNLRIEYVKNQILHKLRMTERPAPVPKDELPEPIQEGYAIQSEDHHVDYLNRHLDDYYAKTTQKIIFLTRGELEQTMRRKIVSLIASVLTRSMPDANLDFFPSFQTPKNADRTSPRSTRPSASRSKSRQTST